MLGRWMLVVVVGLLGLPALARGNILANGDFSDGLTGWEVSRADTQPAIDEEQYHSAPAALRIPPTAERVGMTTSRHTFEQPLPNALSASIWLRTEHVAPNARIGLDLLIVFDDGEETWFFPDSLRLQPAETETWVEKITTYLAPTGKRIAEVQAFCLNYGSDSPAWFDDVAVRAQAVAEPEHDVAVLYTSDPKAPPVVAAWEALARAGIAHDVLPTTVPLESLGLVVVPEWAEDERFYFALKIRHYLGGRVMLMDLPDAKWATALARYFWAALPGDLQAPVTISSEGRAAHVVSAEADAEAVGDVARQLLETELALPDEVPAIDCGPKAPYALRDGALYAGDEPLLLRAMGTYRVTGEQPIEHHRANFAHYADLRLNGLVIYLSHQAPPEHLRALLDAAWENRLRVMLWIYGPPASPYTEKPLKDQWLLRFLPLRRHPAMLG